MSVMLWLLAVAHGGTGVYTAAPLPAGVPITEEQVYALEVDDAWIRGAAEGGVAALVGRIPRFGLPKDTLLRPSHLLPVGSAPGPEGLCPPEHVVRAVTLPVSTVGFRVGNRVDLFGEGASWCLVADRLVVVGFVGPDGAHTLSDADSTGLLLAVPKQAVGVLEAVAHPTVALRNPTDVAPSQAPRCPEAR